MKNEQGHFRGNNLALLRGHVALWLIFYPAHREQGGSKAPLKLPLNALGEYPPKSMQLQKRHILLFRMLRDHCLFLTRRQIQRILTLPTSTANRHLLWLLSEKYLERRFRVDTFAHSQTPLYYLGKAGWHAVGNPMKGYKPHQLRVEQRAEHTLDHTLSIYDVLVKFLLESEVKRIIGSEDKLWQEAIDLGNIPDLWIQFGGGETFIEVDRGTERPIILQKKFENYIKFQISGRYDSLFPQCAFRVLVLVPDEQRIELLEAMVVSDDIWFCTMDEFLREKLGDRHWFALKGFYALPVAPKEEVQKLRQALT